MKSKPIDRSKKQNKGKIQDDFLLYTLLSKISRGSYPKQIAHDLGLQRQLVEYHIKKLAAKNLLKLNFRTSCCIYELTTAGKTELHRLKAKLSRHGGATSMSRFHKLNVKFRIAKDNPQAAWESENQLNNWIQKYSTIQFPIKVTVQKNPDTVVLMFHEYRTSTAMFMTEFMQQVFRGVWFAKHWLGERGIVLDESTAEITDQHLVNERPDLNGKIDDKITTAVHLGRPAQGLFPMKGVGKAWIDRSQGEPEIETNDMLYEEKLLMMPETVSELKREFIPAINRLTDQINLHLAATTEWKKAAQNITKAINQKKLKDFV